MKLQLWLIVGPKMMKAHNTLFCEYYGSALVIAPTTKE